MPRDATSFILRRPGDTLRIFLARRSEKLRFFGGYDAFPGGCLERGDADLPLRPSPALDAAHARFVAAGVRETLEETGLLVGVESTPGDREAIGAWRQALLSERRDFDLAAALRERHLTIDLSRFTYVTRLVTPKFSPQRFDSRFFLVETEDDVASLSGELENGRWLTPREALDAWRRGETFVAPPTLQILEILEREPLSGALEALRRFPREYEGSGRALPWTPGVDVVPLHTPPLPPKTPTNAFLIGEKEFLLVDPGSELEFEQAHLARAVEHRLDRGDRLRAIFLTHHHVDHVAGLEAARQRFDAPVWGHPITAKLLETRFDRELVDGDTIELGRAPDGYSPWRLEALFTPGHAKGHLALYDPHYRTLIAGDLLSTVVSMYVGSPGGDLATYFESLERIRALSLRVLHPAHGPASLDPDELIQRTLEHRRKRIREIERRLGGEPQNVTAVAETVYRNVDPRLREMFVRATRATLEYLDREGRVERVAEDTYRRADTGGEGE